MQQDKLITSTSPHIFDSINKKKIMYSVILALMPAAIAGIIIFGWYSLLVVLVSIASAVLTEAIIQKRLKKKITVSDGSAVITGLLLALTLPPNVPLWLPIVGAAFAISIAKWAFGGSGNVMFNPALVGRAFLVAAWPVLMSSWITPDGVTGATPLGALKMTGEKIASYSQLFLGNIGGTIGETSALVLLVGGLFLIYRRITDWRIPSAYIGTVFILTAAFRQDPLFHILAGGLMIGAFFMATSYEGSPMTQKGKIIFGIGCGIFTVIIRLYSGMAEGVMYSILLMNALTPLIDRYTKLKPFGYIKETMKGKETGK